MVECKMLTHRRDLWGAPILGAERFPLAKSPQPQDDTAACTMKGHTSPDWLHLGAAEAVRQEFALALGELPCTSWACYSLCRSIAL